MLVCTLMAVAASAWLPAFATADDTLATDAPVAASTPTEEIEEVAAPVEDEAPAAPVEEAPSTPAEEAPPVAEDEPAPAPSSETPGEDAPVQGAGQGPAEDIGGPPAPATTPDGGGTPTTTATPETSATGDPASPSTPAGETGTGGTRPTPGPTPAPTTATAPSSATVDKSLPQPVTGDASPSSAPSATSPPATTTFAAEALNGEVPAGIPTLTTPFTEPATPRGVVAPVLISPATVMSVVEPVHQAVTRLELAIDQLLGQLGGEEAMLSPALAALLQQVRWLAAAPAYTVADLLGKLGRLSSMEGRLRGLIARLRALDVDTTVLEQALIQLRRLNAAAPPRSAVADAPPLQQILPSAAAAPSSVVTSLPAPAAGERDDQRTAAVTRPAATGHGGADGIPAPVDGGGSPLAAAGASGAGAGTTLLSGGLAAILVGSLWLGLPRLLRRIELAPATWRRVLLVSLLERPG